MHLKLSETILISEKALKIVNANHENNMDIYIIIYFYMMTL